MSININVNIDGFNLEPLREQAKINAERNRARFIESRRIVDAQKRGEKLREIDLAAGKAQIDIEVAPKNSIIRNNNRYEKPSRKEELAASLFDKYVKADYYVITYGFNTGPDLDTLSSIQNPITKTFSSMIGWTKDERVTVNNRDILIWAGDNIGTGPESILFDRVAYEGVYGGSQSIAVLRLGGLWYGPKGKSVRIKITGYKGGAMILEEDPYGWSNNTAVKVWKEFLTFYSFLDGDFITYVTIDYKKGIVAHRQSLP